MTDNIFFDTNILIYLLSDEENKQKTAANLFKTSEIKIISTQVLSEFTNVCYKKNLIDSGISLYLKQLSKNFNVGLIYKATILKAIQIKEKYNYSYYDSLIIASALQNKCQILYTEDMQHNQTIENSLKIVNPFAK